MKGILVTALIALTINLSAQNLIPNPSFEQVDSCTNWNLQAIGNGLLQFTRFWFTPFSMPFPGGGGSAELFAGCQPDSTLASTPHNIFGYQIPHTGANYAGFWLVAGGGREFIENSLTDTLKTGAKYEMTFYYSFCNNYRTIIDGLGVVFTRDSLMRLNEYGDTIDVPTTVALDSGTITLDTMNWILFDGTFTAKGGEKYFTVGNFKDNAHTVMVQLGGGPVAQECYIYVDDFSLMPLTNTTAAPTLPKQTCSVTPNPANEFGSEIRSSTTPVSIMITDAVGTLVYKGKDTAIRTSEMSNGLYIVTITQNQQVANIKLIVQH